MSRMTGGYAVHLPGCFIAGGAILSRATKTEINDFDVYPKSNKAMIDAFYTLIEDNCFVVNISDRAVTFKSNNITNDKGERGIIQVMTYDTFETADKIFEHFDFTICMGAYDCDAMEHVFHPDFYPDVASKTIRFNPKTRYPLNSLLRLTKYTAKGYYIGKPEHIRMILTTIERGLPTSWQELESQIGGTYGREISLRVEDEPFTIEKAMEVLADIESFTCYERDGEITDEMSTGKYLEDIFSRETKPIVVNDEGKYFLVDTETMVATRALGEVKPKSYTILNESNPEFRLYGYKVLKDNKDGTYGPGLYTHGKKIVYAPEQETVELNRPYLYVFNDLGLAQWRMGPGCCVFRVSYRACDLRAINDGGEIQVTKMTVEEEVSCV